MEKSSGGLQLGKHFRHMGRLAQIANVFARHGFWSLIEGAGVKSWLSDEHVRQAEQISREKNHAGADQISPDGMKPPLLAETGPRRLREAFEELGPAFVKFGQLLCSREDLLPENYIKEFRKLHQDVATVPFATVERILNEELGYRLKEFESISPTPLAAGSIGQVHRAKLRSGEDVVLKIQRPNIAETIKADTALMDLLSSFVEKYFPEWRHIRPRAMVQELTRAIESELDYIREAGSTAKLADNFRNDPHIELPQVYWNYTTARVITLSYIDGYALTESDALKMSGLDCDVLVSHGIDMFLKMVFIDGFYHGDLHAGNLLALDGNRIGLLDCGLTIRIGQSARQNLAGLLNSLLDEDYELLVFYFAELANPQGPFDLADFEEVIAAELSPFVGLKFRKIRIGRLLWRLAKLSAERGAPMPRQLILFFRTISAFEGIASGLSPDFDLMTACQKFSSEQLRNVSTEGDLRRTGFAIARDLAQLARFAPRQIRGLLKQMSDGQMQLNVVSKETQNVASVLDRLASRLSVSIVLAAMLIGSSILVLARAGQEYDHLAAMGVYGFAGAGILALYMIWSIIRGGGRA